MKGVISAIIGYLIAVLVGIIVVVQLLGSGKKAGWSSSANTTWDNITTYIWIGFGLLAIVPIVLIAAVMMGIIGGGKSQY